MIEVFVILIELILVVATVIIPTFMGGLCLTFVAPLNKAVGYRCNRYDALLPLA